MDQQFIVQMSVGILILAILVGSFYRQKKKGKVSNGPVPFAHDLLQRARDGKLDKISGRDAEIDRMVHIMMRRTKNNPLLIGQPGVGKTAIVEGLAMKMIANDVPEAMQKKQLFSLDVSSLVAETKFRGELENRMQGLMKALERFDGQVMLFIDEIHMLEQIGGSEGSLHMSDMLKPALARGQVQVIGATTWQEYEGSIKKDEAMDRRFQPVLVDEPTPKEALAILKHLKPVYEKFHSVQISDSALEEAVNFSDKKITGRYLPDKAIDLLDEAAAMVAIESSRHLVAHGLVNEAAKPTAKKRVTKTDIKKVADQWVIHSKEEKKRDARQQ